MRESALSGDLPGYVKSPVLKGREGELRTCDFQDEGDHYSMNQSQLSLSDRKCGLIRLLPLVVVLIFSASGSYLGAQDFNQARKLMFQGKYSEAEEVAIDGLNNAGRYEEDRWAELLVEILHGQGRWKDAAESAQNWARWDSWGLRKRWLAYESATKVGDVDTQNFMLSEMNQLARRMRERYSEPENQVVLGKMALRLGADAKLVMKNFYDPVARTASETRSVYLAAGDLALEKGDYALASTWFRKGVAKFPDDPAMAFGMARAFSNSDPEETIKWIDKAMEHNDKFIPGRLLLVDMLLNSESYDQANEILAEVEGIQSDNPKMWAYRAVIHHLQNRPDDEVSARQKAQLINLIDAEIPHLIGKKLSHHYRFREGANYQRMALRLDKDYLPSKIQLAQDLLRLGKNDEGWKLASEVHDADGYDVTAFNLVSLHDNLAEYQLVTNANFVIHLDKNEAEIIGEEALGLLQRAWDKLTTKYDFVPKEQTHVEIFSSTTDFEVRTFGMPNIPGYLGVCFGPVITANSPSTPRMSSVNWKAVLWHEFCHTVTLGATRNKMPRWLSEGLSVYEEYQENPAWGMQLTPQFLQWIHDGDLLPVSDLSSGFMRPKTPGHIEFAYYQSSMVVEYLHAEFGESKMASLLEDLSNGIEINAALEKNYASISSIDSGFTEWINERITKAKGKLKFEKPGERRFGETFSGLPGVDVFDQVPGGQPKSDDQNFWELMSQAESLFEEKDFEGAKGVAERILEDFSEPRESPNPLSILTRVYREMDDPDNEKSILEKWGSLEVAPPGLYMRLMDFAAEDQDHAAIERYAGELIAIDPFITAPYIQLAGVAESKGDHQSAISLWKKVLKLGPANPANVHFKLFQLRNESDPQAAWQDLLSTLEMAPRHREALRQFQKIRKNNANRENEIPDAG